MSVTYATTDTLGYASTIGACVLDGEITETWDTTQNKCTLGDYNLNTSEIKSFNHIYTLKMTYQVKSEQSSKTIVLGTASNGYVPTEVSVEQVYNDWAKVVVTAHKHDTGTHVASAYTVTLPNIGFGVVTDPFAKTTTDCVPNSCTWTATADHVDKLDADGDWFTGITKGCKITCVTNYIGQCSDDSVTGWTKDNITFTENNEDFVGSSFSAFKFQSADA